MKNFLIIMRGCLWNILFAALLLGLGYLEILKIAATRELARREDAVESHLGEIAAETSRRNALIAEQNALLAKQVDLMDKSDLFRPLDAGGPK